MAKIKIGLFIDSWFPMIDGVVNVVNSYAEELMKVADVTVFTCGTKKTDNKKYPFKVVRGGSMVVPFLDYEVPITTAKYQKILNSSNLDIVHIHSPFAIGKSGVDYAKEHNIPVVATLHSQYYKDFYRYTKSKWLANNFLKGIVKVFNECDKVYAVNSEVARVGEGYGISPKPLVHNNGTNLDYVKDTKKAFDYFEKKYRIKRDETVLLFVGRINKIKNLVFLIDALYQLKNLGENFKMLFVGSGGDIDELKAQAKRLNLQNEVLFLGRVDDEELVYSYVRAKLFLFPSLYDASSLVQIEAASQKTPTVFIRGAVTSATVTENVNGYLAENSVVEYAKKIQEILHDEITYNKISQNAYDDLYVKWNKTVSRMYQKYLAIIDKHKEEIFTQNMKQKRDDSLKEHSKQLKETEKKQKVEQNKEKKVVKKMKKLKAKMIGKEKLSVKNKKKGKKV